MRFFLSFILSLVVAAPAVAQIGARTGRPNLTEKTVTRAEFVEAGLLAPAADLEATNTSNVRMEVDPADENEDPGACVMPIGRFPTQQKGEDGNYRTLCFWNQKGQEYLKYGRFISSSKTAGVAMEVLSDALGPLRLVLSTAIAANTDTEEPEPGSDEDEPTPSEDKALNLLTTNGGNLAITAALPLYFKPLSNGSVLWNSYARLGGNVQAFGEENESSVNFNDANASLELAFSEFQIDLLTQQKNFNLLGYAKTSAIVGTEQFAKSIGDARRAFLHGQVGAGLRISDLLNVYLTYNWYSDDKVPGGGGAITFAMGK